MFFLDSTGFFSLICLLIQCAVAWIFAAFFGALATGQRAWLRALQASFLGLGIGLTAMCLRFALAHHAVAGRTPVDEGAWPTRLFYALYLAGKVMFARYLLVGVQILCGVAVCGRSLRSLLWIVAGFTAGLLLPTAESLLLFQAPWIVLVSGRAAWLLRRTIAGDDDPWRRVVVRVLAATAVAWFAYGIAVLMTGPVHPGEVPPWNALLRSNSLIDLVLQVVLATSLMIVAMNEAHQATLDVLRDRDRLREQVQRDEKLRALSTLVSGVAHEINNPLTAILGFADDLADADAKVRERAATVVREQAERCRAIVQRMSLLGRRASLVVTPVDVPALVQRVVRGFAHELQRMRVHLDIDSIQIDRPFFADATGVEQVLVNLIGNALHASPAGGVVRIGVFEEPEALVLRVSDQGAGVPVADRTRIFEPFWTTKQEGQGTGLGLAVVDAIVRAHGGRVEVGDARGGGACFTVHWPSQPQAATTTEPRVPTAPRPAVGAAAAPGKGRRLLVIDDESVVRSTIARQARLDGWEVVEVDGAERALELLAAPGADFDAIACDLRMPGMSGLAFHDELARRAPHWLQRLLFITGDLTSSDAVQFAARCRAPILTKPFAATELLHRLRELRSA